MSSSLLTLPEELQEIIFRFLPAGDLGSIESCSKSIRNLVVKKDLWRKRADIIGEWVKKRMKRQVIVLEERQEYRTCGNQSHHVYLARVSAVAKFRRGEDCGEDIGDCQGPVIQELLQRPPEQVSRYYTHKGCGQAVCTECLDWLFGNCQSYCLACLDWTRDEEGWWEDEYNSKYDFEYEDEEEEESKLKVKEDDIMEKVEAKEENGLNQENIEGGEKEAYLQNEDEDEESIVLEKEDEIKENIEVEEEVNEEVEGRKDGGTEDWDKSKPHPADWEPSAQVLVDQEEQRGARLQEVLGREGGGKKVIRGLLEMMMLEPLS